MHLNKKVQISFIIVLLMCFSACSTLGYFGIGGKENWTAKKKSTYFMKVYNETYQECLQILTNVNSPEPEMNKAKANVEILKQLRPYIQLYDSQMLTGKPTQTLENAIWSLIGEIEQNKIGA